MAARDFLMRGECPPCLARRVNAGVVRGSMTLLYGVLFISGSVISGCRGIISGGGELHSPCPAGALTEECNCGGILVDTGYCCDGEHQTNPCREVPNCGEGEVTSACLCGETLVDAGYCCASEQKTHACVVPDCDLGEILFDCRCGEGVVSAGYCCREVHQTDACAFKVHFVSSSEGADDNTGLSASAPWKTLDKVNTAPLDAGDAILFKRGDMWSGTVTVSASGTAGNPITYGAYGVGEKPRIYGSEEITGWTLHSGNIYKATVSHDITQLFVEGRRANLARYPKAGYIRITTVEPPTQFVSTSLPSQELDYYKNAMWAGKTNLYTMSQRTVVASDGQTIALDSEPHWELDVNEGFFLANKLVFLTQAGEWHYDAATKTLYFWPPDGNSPANGAVRGSVYDHGISIGNDKDRLVIEDLELLHASHYGIYMYDSNYVTVKNNDIFKIQRIGIYSSYAGRDIVIEGNKISDIFLGGIRLSVNYGDCVITRNVVDTIGRMASLGSAVSTTSSLSPGVGITSLNYKVNGMRGVHDKDYGQWGRGVRFPKSQRGARAALARQPPCD